MTISTSLKRHLSSNFDLKFRFWVKQNKTTNIFTKFIVIRKVLMVYFLKSDTIFYFGFTYFPALFATQMLQLCIIAANMRGLFSATN